LRVKSPGDELRQASPGRSACFRTTWSTDSNNSRRRDYHLPLPPPGKFEFSA
jgi:hypothetical protein